MSVYKSIDHRYDTSILNVEEDSNLISKLNLSVQNIDMKGNIKRAKTLEAMSKHMSDLGVNTDSLSKEQLNKLQLE